MEKQSSSPTTRESSTYSIHDPPGYIEPSLQDLLFTDITAERLLSVARLLGVDYLSPAATFPGFFPVDGEIYRPNNRLMMSLVCRRRGRDTQAINVIFLIDTGSPVSYLSEKTMEALIGNPASHLPEQLQVLWFNHKKVSNAIHHRATNILRMQMCLVPISWSRMV